MGLLASAMEEAGDIAAGEATAEDAAAAVEEEEATAVAGAQAARAVVDINSPHSAAARRFEGDHISTIRVHSKNTKQQQCSKHGRCFIPPLLLMPWSLHSPPRLR